MLLDDTSVWKNPRTGLWERMFPSDFAPPGFKSVSPSLDELADWLLDPAIASQLRKGSFTVNRDSFTGLAIGQLDVLNALRLVDWARAQEGRIYELVSHVGLIRAEDIQAIAPTAHAMLGSLVGLLQTEPDALAEELAGKAAFEFYKVVSSFSAQINPYVMLAAQIVGLGVQVFESFRSVVAGEADLARARVPLHTYDARKRSDDARVTAMRTVMAGSRDWTEFYMPPFAGEWALRQLGEPRPKRQGFGLGMAHPHGGEEFSPSGGWGVMPGTGRCLDLLQLEPNWRSLRDRQEDRRPPPSANWYSYYCDAVDEGCLQSPDTFAGTKNCRQCIPIDSIRGSTRGDWREYSHSFVSTVVNVGDWLANSTQALTALWTSFSVSNPATYCVDTGRLYFAWQRVWEQFFDAFIPAAWMARDAYPTRALISHFAAWSLVSREDGQLGGRGTLLDWRMRRWGEHQDDGINVGPTAPIAPVYSGCPVEGVCGSMDPDVLAIRRITPTPFLLENSVWKQAIEPAVQRLALVQLAGYKTTTCAYLWMDQGAHADPATGELRKDQFGRAFEEALRAIINTKRLRNAVHMAHVVDPKIKKLLLESGAHPWQTGTGIAAPELPSSDGKPPRATVKPDDSPILAFTDDWTPPPGAGPLVGGFAGTLTAERVKPPESASSSRGRRLAAVAGGGALLGLLGWALARRSA